MKVQEAIIRRITELCNNNNFTYNAIANYAGLPPSTLKNILNGSSQNPGIVTIKIICDGLDISIREFFDSNMFDELEQEIC